MLMYIRKNCSLKYLNINQHTWCALKFKAFKLNLYVSEINNDI